MKKLLLIFLLAPLLVGCGTLIPKRVELGQDKVQKFPLPSNKEEEARRQALQRLSEKAREAERTAQGEASSAEVPAAEAGDLAEALERSYGPPKDYYTGPSSNLVEKLDHQTATYQAELRGFARDNDKNVGKKIEDTGILKIPYFLWVGGLFVACLIGYAVLKVGLGMVSAMNPAVGLGLNGAANVGSAFLSKAFSQVLKGGEEFKKALDKIIPDKEIAQKVKDHFRATHQQSQDEQVQNLIKELTK
jgi:hypothetical protein